MREKRNHPSKDAGVFDSLTYVVTQELVVALPFPSPLESGLESGYGAGSWPKLLWPCEDRISG